MVDRAGSDDIPWADVFCGRERELDTLKAAWARVASADPEPQIVALVGESGLGKTRLVQAFYNWLATEVDAAGEGGYWPDKLLRERNNLKINPDPETCRGDRAMPFLWWGVRTPDPFGRNPGRGGISADRDRLAAHLEPFARAKLRAQRRGDLAKDAAMDAAAEVANIFTFGLIGLAKTAYQHGRELFDIESERRRDRAEGVDPGAAAGRAHLDIVEIVLTDLAQLLDADPDKGSRLPVVIALDDAHWAQDDPATFQFAERLMRAALAKGWPLLLIVTHWETEWHQGAISDEPCLARLFGDLATEGLLAADWAPLLLGKGSDLRAMIFAGLPGLTPAQQDMILEKADGNPRLMDEILRHLRSRPKFFEGRSIDAALNAKGEAEIASTHYDLHGLIAERLAEADRTVQAAVGLSSLQGMKFLGRLTGAMAEALAEEGIDLGLAQAERPHAMVQSLEEGVAEFAQRVYREVAEERLDDLLDADEAREILRGVLSSFAGEGAGFEALSPAERVTAWGLGAELCASDEGDAEDHALAARCSARLARHLLDTFDPAAASRVAAQAVAREAEGVCDLNVLTFPELDALQEAAMAGGALAAGEDLARRLLSVAETNDDGSPPARRNRWAALALWGDVEETLYGAALAIPHYEAALALAREIVADSDAPEARRSLAASLSRLGDARAVTEGYGAALDLIRESAELAEALAEEERTTAAWHDFSVSLIGLGDASAFTQAYAVAVDYYWQAVDIRRSIIEALDTVDTRRALGLGLMKLGDALAQTEGPHAAFDAYMECHDIALDLAQRLGTPQARRDLALASQKVGDVLFQVEGAAAALQAYGASLDISASLSVELGTPSARRSYLFALARLVSALIANGNIEEANELLEDAQAIAEGFREADLALDRWAYLTWAQRVLLLISQTASDFDAMRPLVEEVLPVAESVALDIPGTDSATAFGTVLIFHAQCRLAIGDEMTAIAALQRALALFDDAVPADLEASALLQTANLLAALPLGVLETGQLDLAEAILARAADFVDAYGQRFGGSAMPVLHALLLLGKGGCAELRGDEAMVTLCLSEIEPLIPDLPPALAEIAAQAISGDE